MSVCQTPEFREYLREQMEDDELIMRGEIVRCRDCAYLIAHGTGCSYWDYCDIESIDGFCAWGERRWLMCKCGEEIELGDREYAVCPSCGRTVRE